MADFTNTNLVTQDISNQLFDTAVGLSPQQYGITNSNGIGSDASSSLLQTASNLGTSLVSSASGTFAQYQTPLMVALIAGLVLVAVLDIKPRRV